MANAAIDSGSATQAPAVSGLLSGPNGTHVFGAPIPVYIPYGENVFIYVGVLPPSFGTGVFIPVVDETFHGGTEDGFHGNTRRGGEANARVDGPADDFVFEIDEGVGAWLIGVELYDHINFNA